MKKQLLLEKINKDEMVQHLKDYYKYAKTHLDIEESPKVIFVSDEDNANDFLGKTGYYDPKNKSIHLYILNRHPKDIVRSFAHELIHHYQNLHEKLPDDILAGTKDIDYASKNKDLRDMEREAFEKGNMMFRDWTDSLKKKKLKENGMKKKYTKKNLQEAFRGTSGAGFNTDFDLDALKKINPELYEIFKTTGDKTDQLPEFNAKEIEVTDIFKKNPANTFDRKKGFMINAETQHANVFFGFGKDYEQEKQTHEMTQDIHRQINKFHEEKYDTQGARSSKKYDAIDKFGSETAYNAARAKSDAATKKAGLPSIPDEYLEEKKSSKGMSYDAAKKAGVKDPKAADRRPPDGKVSGYEAAVSKAIQKTKARKMEEAQELQEADPRLKKVFKEEERLMNDYKTTREQNIYNELMARILKQGK